MRPWQRDLTALLGLALVAGAAFMASMALGLLVTGIELMGIALATSFAAVPAEEDEDGDG